MYVIQIIAYIYYIYVCNTYYSICPFNKVQMSVWCIYISPTESPTNAMTHELLSVYICNTDYRIHVYYIYVCNTYWRTSPFNIVFLPLHTIMSVSCIIYIANSITHERNKWPTNSSLSTDMDTHSSDSTTHELLFFYWHAHTLIKLYYPRT